MELQSGKMWFLFGGSEWPPEADVQDAVGRSAAFFVRVVGLQMHPFDGISRTQLLKEELGIGL